MAGDRNLTGRCPACGASWQGMVFLRSLNRRWRRACSQCHSPLESSLSIVAWLAICFWSQLWLFVVIAPLLAGLLGGRWLLAGLAVLAWLILVVPLAMILHARNLHVRQP